MKKFMVYSLQWIVGLAIFLFIVICPISTVYAAEATPSSSLESKLKALENEIASKAAVLKSQIGKQLDNRIVTGLVQSKTDSQIILTSEQDQSSTSNDFNPDANKNQIVLINKFTTLTYEDNLPKNISQDDFVVALGNLDDKSNLVAQEIVKQKEPDLTPIVYIWGQIQEASSSAMVVKDKDKTQDVSFSKDTSFQSGNDGTSLKSLKSGLTVIAAGPIDAGSQNLQAQFIYIYPPTQSPTPASTSNASSFAKPK